VAYYCARRVGRIYTTTSGVEGLQSRIKNSDQKIFDLGDLESPKVLIPTPEVFWWAGELSYGRHRHTGPAKAPMYCS
jgi:hypothetical protein